MEAGTPNISAAQVPRAVARLARLDLSDAQVEHYRGHLSAVLAYMDSLRALDLAGVEPMMQPVETTGRLAEDAPGPMLPTAVLLAMAPASMGPFIEVPKVIGDSGGT